MKYWRNQVTVNRSDFCHLDIFSEFWTIKLDDKSLGLCAFQTAFDFYRCLRLPCGTKTSILKVKVNDEKIKAIIDMPSSK